MADTEFDNMSTTDLRKVIADITKDTLTLQEDKKAYVAGVNEVVKDNNARMKRAVAALRLAEKAGGDAQHEENVKQFLKTVK